MRTRRHWPESVRAIESVAAGIKAFGRKLVREAEEVIGPRQWELATSVPGVIGPTSGWFTENFRKAFDGTPDYVAAGVFAAGLIGAECISRAAHLERHCAEKIAM